MGAGLSRVGFMVLVRLSIGLVPLLRALYSRCANAQARTASFTLRVNDAGAHEQISQDRKAKGGPHESFESFDSFNSLAGKSVRAALVRRKRERINQWKVLGPVAAMAITLPLHAGDHTKANQEVKHHKYKVELVGTFGGSAKQFRHGSG
jgi:hypothetical protein